MRGKPVSGSSPESGNNLSLINIQGLNQLNISCNIHSKGLLAVFIYLYDYYYYLYYLFIYIIIIYYLNNIPTCTSGFWAKQ